MAFSLHLRRTPAIVWIFFFGSIFYLVVRLLMYYFAAGEPLTPIDKRMPGGLSAEVFLPAPASAATAPATQSAAWKLADHAGRVVLVNYFATWCGPCLEETPELVAIANDYQSRGLVTVAISVDTDDDRVGGEGSRIKALQRYASSYQVPFPILVPPADSPLWKMNFSIPQTFLFDRQGRRALHIVGAFDDRALRKSLDQLLAEAPGSIPATTGKK
jgi:thiol-disulfide isomerase/thioredoxin